MNKTYKAKSITISRKPGKDREKFWIAFIGLFNENNPHLKCKIPFEVLDIEDVEKVRIFDLRNISFYLMGNDIVINDLTEVSLKKDGNVLVITGKQKF